MHFAAAKTMPPNMLADRFFVTAEIPKTIIPAIHSKKRPRSITKNTIATIMKPSKASISFAQAPSSGNLFTFLLCTVRTALK